MKDTVKEQFDFVLARECAKTFHGASGIGCVISAVDGEVMNEFGYGCQSCGLCEAMGKEKRNCVQAHIYGMTEAERFGGKYIYYCPMGLTCFVSPILGEVTSVAKITVGPFLMVDKQDFIDCELSGYAQLPKEKTDHLERALSRIPVISPQTVQHLSTLLFMAVGFMNNVSYASRMRTAQQSDAIQGQITTYIMHLKEGEWQPYPIATERELLRSIVKSDQEKAHRLLNELLGYILFSTGRDFERLKTRIYELLVLMGRAAADAGANAELILSETSSSFERISSFRDIEELCLWLSHQMNRFMDGVFQYADARHANVIHRCIQYIDAHYYEKISLEQMARIVYLSPAYLSRIFKQETGEPFNAYVSRVRIEKSKVLLRHDALRISDIAGAAGFEDQSYFTKVFKRMVGVTPNRYRDMLRQK